MSGMIARSKRQIRWALIVLWAYFAITLFFGSWTPFFGYFKYKAVRYEDLSAATMENGRSVGGSMSGLVDCIAEGETTHRSVRTGVDLFTTRNSYYFVAVLNDDTMMLVRTQPDDYHFAIYTEMVNRYWESLDPDSGVSGKISVSIDGYLRTNDPQLVHFYNDWYKEVGFEEAGYHYTLAPYTLDITKPYKKHVRNFIIGAFMLIVGIVAVVSSIIDIKKNGFTNKPAAAPAYSPAGYSAPAATGSAYGDTYRSSDRRPQDGYGVSNSFKAQGSGTSSSTAQTQGTSTASSCYQSQASSYGTPSGYQSQSGSYGTPSNYQSQSGSYGTPSGYQSQNSSYGTSSNYQSQSGSYGTSSNYQSQSGSYGTPSGYQSQNGSYGTSNGYQSQGGSYGTPSGYRSQSGSYGTSSGYRSQGSSYGTPSGYRSQSGSYGTSSGYRSQGSSYGTPSGYRSQGSSYGTSSGYRSQSGSSGDAQFSDDLYTPPTE